MITSDTRNAEVYELSQVENSIMSWRDSPTDVNYLSWDSSEFSEEELAVRTWEDILEVGRETLLLIYEKESRLYEQTTYVCESITKKTESWNFPLYLVDVTIKYFVGVVIATIERVPGIAESFVKIIISFAIKRSLGERIHSTILYCGIKDKKVSLAITLVLLKNVIDILFAFVNSLFGFNFGIATKIKHDLLSAVGAISRSLCYIVITLYKYSEVKKRKTDDFVQICICEYIGNIFTSGSINRQAEKKTNEESFSYIASNPSLLGIAATKITSVPIKKIESLGKNFVFNRLGIKTFEFSSLEDFNNYSVKQSIVDFAIQIPDMITVRVAKFLDPIRKNFIKPVWENFIKPVWESVCDRMKNENPSLLNITSENQDDGIRARDLVLMQEDFPTESDFYISEAFGNSKCPSIQMTRDSGNDISNMSYKPSESQEDDVNIHDLIFMRTIFPTESDFCIQENYWNLSLNSKQKTTFSMSDIQGTTHKHHVDKNCLCENLLDCDCNYITNIPNPGCDCYCKLSRDHPCVLTGHVSDIAACKHICDLPDLFCSCNNSTGV